MADDNQHRRLLVTLVLTRSFALQTLPEIEVGCKQIGNAFGRIKSRDLNNVTAFPIDGHLTLLLRDTVVCLSEMMDSFSSERFVQSVERVRRRWHVKYRQFFLDVPRNERFYRMSDKQVGLFDEPENVVPNMSLWRIRHVREMRLYLNMTSEDDFAIWSLAFDQGNQRGQLWVVNHNDSVAKQFITVGKPKLVVVGLDPTFKVSLVVWFEILVGFRHTLKDVVKVFRDIEDLRVCCLETHVNKDDTGNYQE
jgi:hypothetical protein